MGLEYFLTHPAFVAERRLRDVHAGETSSLDKALHLPRHCRVFGLKGGRERSVTTDAGIQKLQIGGELFGASWVIQRGAGQQVVHRCPGFSIKRLYVLWRPIQHVVVGHYLLERQLPFPDIGFDFFPR